MANRREFLKIGLAAASAWPLGAAAAGESAPTLSLYKVIYDVRHPQSVAFARRAGELGARVQAIEGDMTRVWYDDVYHRWKQGPAALAGLTTHGPLFCFEQLALDQRMRVVFRAKHKARAADGTVEHDFTGPSSVLDAACVAAERGDWAAGMAGAIMQCRSGRVEIAAATSRGVAALADRDRAEALYTWVIAPAVRG